MRYKVSLTKMDGEVIDIGVVEYEWEHPTIEKQQDTLTSIEDLLFNASLGLVTEVDDEKI